MTWGAVAAGRHAAVARMLSTVTVCRRTGGTTTDSDGFEVDEFAAVIEDSPFRLGGAPQGSSQSRRVSLDGGLEVQLGVRVGHLPAGTVPLTDGDVVKVESGENGGSFWRVVEGDWQDQATAYRVPLISTTQPAGWPA